MIRRIAPFLSLLVSTAVARTDVQTFENDHSGFVEAAGPLSVIDFETDPNGDPPQTGEDLTETFNYDAQGIHFSAGYSAPPFQYPMFDGGPPFDLAVLAPPLFFFSIPGSGVTSRRLRWRSAGSFPVSRHSALSM